jgi:glycerol-3-phosphate acyltransferase PlsY
MDMTFPILLLIGGYLLGSVASAIIVCRAFGLPDPREGGSGNPGATNVLRIGGKTPAALTLVGDVLKGLIPVLIAKLVVDSNAIAAGVALTAFLGHLYPIFFGFAGGKGVATAFGALLAFAWPVGLGVLATWLTIAATTRYSSLSALIASIAAPLLTLALIPDAAAAVIVTIMALILIWRHRANIARLMSGEEDKIGAKKATTIEP